MAHLSQQRFCEYIRDLMPYRFRDCNVLDAGSLDVNGNNRYLFTDDFHYVGLDIGPGKNVDIISKIHEYNPLKPQCFDIVISTECFEHDPYWEKSLPHCVSLIKPGGLFLFTCAAPGRPEHGTVRSGTPQDAPHIVAQFGNYYRPLDKKDIFLVLNFSVMFSYQELYQEDGDLKFWGIKKWE